MKCNTFYFTTILNISFCFSKCDVEAGLSIQSLSVFPSSYHTVLDKGRYPIYLLVSGLTLSDCFGEGTIFCWQGRTGGAN